MRLRISARSSHLARLQALLVGEALRRAQADLEIEYLFRESLGDKNLQDPLWKLPQKGVFTEDFYRDLVEGRTDLVVHSWKDLPLEDKPETEIAATLQREDQRDLLLFKKASRGRKDLRIFTSSPRREYNLRPFFKDVIPGASTVEFVSVRGNVPTRIKKLFEDPSVDALVLAKAAIDRFLLSTEEEMREIQGELRAQLQKCDWMVLPLSENPNAAAQGALAIEIHRERGDLRELLRKVHQPEVARAVQRERAELGRYGGGCHQKIGVAFLTRDYGDILIVRGLTDQNETLRKKSLLRESDLKTGRKWSSSVMKDLFLRQEIPFQIPPDTEAVFVSRASAWQSFSGLVWAAGTETWKKLAQMGIWVHGCSEGLGEQENPRLQGLAGKSSLKWVKLTHLSSAQNQNRADNQIVATYEMRLVEGGENLIAERYGKHVLESDTFFWTSPTHFAVLTKMYPSILERQHASGPGLTSLYLRDQIGREPLIFLSEGEFYDS